jgi:DNA polymerase-3 subunit alpha
LQILIFIGAFRFTGKQKHELLIESRFLWELIKLYLGIPHYWRSHRKIISFPSIERNRFEDAFDEIEILGFPVSFSPFDLLQTRYRGSVLVKDLLKFHKQQVKMLAYLISRKHVPTKKEQCISEPGLMLKENILIPLIFPTALKNILFRVVVAIFYWEP